MQSRTSPEEPVLDQEPSSLQPASSSADPSYKEVDIGGEDPGQTSSTSTSGTPGTDRGGNRV